MEYTTLGKTGLKVSVAGLGCGGFSRLGLPHGKTEDEAARLIHEAVGLGINLLDTAPVYGTEAVVGKALKSIPAGLRRRRHQGRGLSQQGMAHARARGREPRQFTAADGHRPCRRVPAPRHHAG